MKEVVIVFSDSHLAYSPTVLNLFEELKKHFIVSLIAPEPTIGFTQKITDKSIHYYKESNTLSLVYSFSKIKHKILCLFNKRLPIRSLITPQAQSIISFVKNKSVEIIAVDFFSLWCVQQAGEKAHLVSLEISENDLYKHFCDFSGIKSVIIQSDERYNYLFSKVKPKYFIIQNSPRYIDFVPDYNSRRKTDLIYCGSAMPWFGIMSCIDFIKDYPKYTLTIKGAIPSATLKSINSFYANLLTEGRLILDSTYLDAVSLTHFVSKFRIGFGFYDFYRFENVNTFNYYTAPSGKVFQYLNSGVPIIANNLKGFELIEQKNAGVLISHLSSIAIKSAIDAIELDYKMISNNAKEASKSLDFSKNVIPFITYLKALTNF